MPCESERISALLPPLLSCFPEPGKIRQESPGPERAESANISFQSGFSQDFFAPRRRPCPCSGDRKRIEQAKIGRQERR